ncbi:MAG TPA: corrinoid protein [Nitrospinota bacterium]|nr:corrinoid protein [Nitrospinota bacterium]
MDYNLLSMAVEKGDGVEVERLTRNGIEEGLDVCDILDKGLMLGFHRVGERFKKQEAFIPEVLIAAKAIHAGLNLIRPLLKKKNIKPLGTFIIGTVLGDMHDIGQTIVAMMMENSGFKVVNLGVNVPPSRFIQTLKKEEGDIVGLSALLTTTMVNQRLTIEEIKKAGIRERVKIMIGGAPVNQAWADEIGADAYAEDATTAVEKAKELLK